MAICFRNVVGKLLWIALAASAQTLNCSMTCLPAPDNTSEACNTNTRECLFGCKDRYVGPSCSFQCPEACALPKYNSSDICNATTGECLFGCMDRYVGPNCTLQCPENCALPNDNSSDICHATTGNCLNGCRYPHAGPNCTFQCSSHCVKSNDSLFDTCNTTSGECFFGCVQDYAGYASDNCSVKCPSNCREPPEGDDSAVCDVSTMHCVFGCNDGFYGSQCLLQCKDAVLLCAVCHVDSGSNPICTLCPPNFYLSYGQCKSCSYWCAEGTPQPCDPDDGICTHGCKAGRTGRYCDKYCSSLCNGTICDQLTARCPNGCNNVAYCGSTCQISCGEGCLGKECLQSCECRKGCYSEQWGDNCDKTCSLNCNRVNSTNVCGRADGSCLNGCLNQTWWGKTCDQNCSGFCSDSQCDNGTGECIHGCLSNRVYGPKCDQNCSSNCQNGTCRRVDGHCEDGCELGWFGDRCDRLCSASCVGRGCNRTNAYCECETGWHGKTCSEECGKACLSSACEQESGFCIYGCISGYEGDKCDKLVNLTNRCNISYCGLTCQSSCNEGCLSRACDRSCTCENGCYPERWGNACDRTCPEKCTKLDNSTNFCGRLNGKCLIGCINDEWSGEECNEPCSAFCNKGKCNQSTGNCLYGCLGNKFYGQKCERNCPSDCNNGTCSKDNGYCLQGSNSDLPLFTTTALGVVIGEGILCLLLLTVIVWLLWKYVPVKGLLYKEENQPETSNSLGSRDINLYTDVNRNSSPENTATQYESLQESSLNDAEEKAIGYVNISK